MEDGRIDRLVKMSQQATVRKEMGVIKKLTTLGRWGITIWLLYLAFKETGIATVALLTLVVIYTELNTVITNRIIRTLKGGIDGNIRDR